jgi:hypothetical protein
MSYYIGRHFVSRGRMSKGYSGPRIDGVQAVALAMQTYIGDQKLAIFTHPAALRAS